MTRVVLNFKSMHQIQKNNVFGVYIFVKKMDYTPAADTSAKKQKTITMESLYDIFNINL